MRDFKRLPQEESSSRGMGLRMRLVAFFFFCCFAAVLGRAVQLQYQQAERLQGLAEEQYVRELEIPARRGDVFDRRGIALAQSVDVDSIWVDPSMLPDLVRASHLFARRLSLDRADLLARLRKAKRFVWLKRQVEPREVEAIQKLNLPGIGYAKEPRRFYPQKELAAHVMGVVGMDGKGLEGLELAFDDELSGHAAVLPGFRDAKGRKLLTEGGVKVGDSEGASVTLTLDRHLQYVTERALGVAVDEAKATSGIAVVLDPRTGEILALANFPRFNPNVPTSPSNPPLRNRAALDAFEPGSTIKSLMVAGALEEGVVRPSSVFDCEGGTWNVGGHTVHDSHPHGSLTVATVLQVSSNIGAAKIAMLLGRDRMTQYYRAFGLGDRSGLGLAGEAKGNLPFPKAEISLATQAFGQGLTATAVQLSAAYGALANKGVLMRPFLVAKVVDRDGLVLLENGPTVVRRVVSEKTAHTVVGMLEAVVEKEGTAPRAKMEEYRVAGKTGTAQKVDPVARGYSDKRIASFIGMVPAEAPRLVVAVVVDEPKTDVYGGLVAAPAFREIAEAAMPYLGVAPSHKAMARAPMPSQPVVARAPIQISVEPAVTEETAEGSVQVPDLRGHGGRDAVSRLLSATLAPRVVGSGWVVSQQPSPGMRVARGARVTVELGERL